MKIMAEVLPNDNEKGREGRDGRVRISNRRTWVVVANGNFIEEYRTKRQALAEARRINESQK